MPVIGHAFVGLTTAFEAAPRGGLRRSASMWIPVVVALAYLPDLIGQAMTVGGDNRYQQLGHSVFVAAGLSLLAGVLLVAMFGVSWRRGLIVAALSVFIHIGLDLITGGHRVLWPLTSAPIGLRGSKLSNELAVEIVVFPLAFVIYLFVRHSKRCVRLPHGKLGLVLTGGILAAAGLTHGMESLRFHQFGQAGRLLNRKEYAGALQALDKAAGWPWCLPPGRIDFMRAEAYAGLGDATAAERLFRESYQADPTYFWCVGCLARFYAKQDAPLDWRRQMVEPLRRQLQEQFSHEKACASFLASIDRHLGYAESASKPVSQPAR